MSERGVFAVDRGIWDHDVLSENQPFSRREAWLWLLSEAAWKPHKRRIIGRTIELGRGQYAGSLRFIASKWQWTEARVRRFLAVLTSSEMIDASTDAGVTVITVCKYEEYQRVSLPTDANPKIDVDAAPTQQRRKVEDKEDKEAGGEGGVTREPVINPARGKSMISEDAFVVSEEILVAMGLDPHHPLCVGSPLTVQGWFNAGLHRDCILTGVRRAMQNRGRDPPSTLKYFEKAILRSQAELAPTLPKIEAPNVQANHRRTTNYPPKSGGGFASIAARLSAGQSDANPRDGDSAGASGQDGGLRNPSEGLVDLDTQ
jgi:hypothetical protein